MKVIPINKITKKQLDTLNTQYNGNLKSMTNTEYLKWKTDLIKEGYIWNDLDGWGFWSIPLMPKRKKHILSSIIVNNDDFNINEKMIIISNNRNKLVILS